MSVKKDFWVTLALTHLSVTALLGVMLRTKIRFPMPGIDFSNLLHAHSHFAFCGWISIMLICLMVYDILPKERSEKKIYTWILAASSLSAWGMFISFLFQGYGTWSIFFSSFFTLVTYVFSCCFIRDIIRSRISKAVALTAVASAASLVLSSAGPLTLAWISITNSGSHFIYKNALYTYLHFQYNGFFTLGAFALLFNSLRDKLNAKQHLRVYEFCLIYTFAVIPSLFISYLWQMNDTIIKSIAYTGCLLIILALFFFLKVLGDLKKILKDIPPFIRNTGLLAIIAFSIKSVLQTGTVYPELGRLVYGDRAVIIGYLHLVFLGFITLYLLAHLLYANNLDAGSGFTRAAVSSFAAAVVANETVLMLQGFGNMLMISNSLYTTALWIIAIWLFISAFMILLSRIRLHEKKI
jgi:hypothetical protein